MFRSVIFGDREQRGNLCLNGGVVYLAAIIDWYSKAVLSYKISNTMDTDLVMSVLSEALLKYGKPEIFNDFRKSEQLLSRSQYTSYIHTKTLQDNGITISMEEYANSI